MPEAVRLSYVAALILKAVSAGRCYGLEIMEVAGLPSGTVYPALRRLESAGLIRSRWEAESIAAAQQRPVRKYYEVTRDGAAILTTGAGSRYLLPEFQSNSTPSAKR